MAFSYFSLLLFMLLLLSSCEKVINVDLPKGYKRLVVEGWITTEPGPYIVTISYTKDYAYTYDNTIYNEERAQVTIKDDKGESALLKEVKPGVYATDSSGIRGEVGRSYTLIIQTEDGRTFESIPELIKPVPIIDTIYYSLNYSTIDKSGNPGLSGFMEYKDPPDEKNYYSKKQYEFLMNGRLFTLDISNYSDKFFDGKKYKHQILSEFNSEVVVVTTIQKIELFSLSKNAFDFWALVESQTDKVGGPYDPPPAPIIGNIYNINDKKDYALGFFGASAISKAEILVKPR